jgi:hypothetical protein
MLMADIQPTFGCQSYIFADTISMRTHVAFHGGQIMAKAIVIAAFLASLACPALAACPAGTSYQCYQGYNGKVVCGSH